MSNTFHTLIWQKKISQIVNKPLSEVCESPANWVALWEFESLLAPSAATSTQIAEEELVACAAALLAQPRALLHMWCGAQNLHRTTHHRKIWV